MKYFLVDISNNTERILKDFAFCILSRNAKKLAPTANFTAEWTLKTAKMRVSVLPAAYFGSLPKDAAASASEITALKKQNETLNRRMRMESNYLKYLQMYYTAESTGYTLYTYFEERGLLKPNVKIAFFAVDELGVLVYQICERLGIKFSALTSNASRTIKLSTHPNFPAEELVLRPLNMVDKSEFTNVFMATIWNAEEIAYVRTICGRLFLFDAVVQASYTRAFFINKIVALQEQNPGIRVGVFFTPYVHQIPGEHSELEEFYRVHGMKMPNILMIDDETMREKAKTFSYRQYGFDDEYIDCVCNASYTITKNENGVWLMHDFQSKYANVVAHRRVTTDTPEEYSNTIYFFGDSLVTGLHVGDSETIESNLQRIINDNALPYCVQNCANSYGLKYDWIFTLAETITYKEGDILLFCSRVDWLTEQLIKSKAKNELNGVLGIYTTPLFQRPHNHGEVFTDDHHFNGKGYGLIAQKIFEDIKAVGLFEHMAPPPRSLYK
jgi:hypothetical protein